MEAQTVQAPQTQKYLVRNNTAGWVGVIKLNHRGEEVGESVEPYGTAWLSESEIILTARAPRLPEDNPFEEQTLVRVNPETQAREDFKIRPLTLERDADRYTPAEDRYVPTLVAPEDAAPAQAQEAAIPPPTVAAPGSRGAPTAPEPPPAPPVSVAPPGPNFRQPETPRGMPEPSEERQSWVQEAEAPGRVLPGRLEGSNEPAPHPERHPDPKPALPDERFVPSVIGAQAAPQTPGMQEEFAEAVDPRIGEETGQAKPPAGPPEEGEWAWAEEVGDPEAPTTQLESETINEHE